jgi:hypothetical protein
MPDTIQCALYFAFLVIYTLLILIRMDRKDQEERDNIKNYTIYQHKINGLPVKEFIE